VIFALIKIRFLETLAYRAESFLWMVTLTMPLVMLVLWRSVAEDGTFHGYTPEDFNIYYLAVLVATLLTGCNSVWEVSEDIRTGGLSFWLMRPMHPFTHYVAVTFAELGLRLLVALPILAIALAMSLGSSSLNLTRLALLVPAFLNGLLINQAIHLLTGSLSFWMERSLVVHKLYVTACAVLSGYMFPLSFLPGWAEHVALLLPFRFIIALPVEILMEKVAAPVEMVIWQTALAVALLSVAGLVWRRGVNRYSAFG